MTAPDPRAPASSGWPSTPTGPSRATRPSRSRCGTGSPARPPPTPARARCSSGSTRSRSSTARAGPTTTRPARLAERLLIDPSHSLYSGIGGTTPQQLVQKAGEAIIDGAYDLALICGAEALATKRRHEEGRARSRCGASAHPEPPPFPFEAPFHPAEIAHEVFQAWLTFALFDIGRRAHLGVSPDDDRRALGELLAPMTEVAAANPFAWFPTARSADELVDRDGREPHGRLPVHQVRGGGDGRRHGRGAPRVQPRAGRRAGRARRPAGLPAGLVLRRPTRSTWPSTPTSGGRRRWPRPPREALAPAGVGIDDVAHLDLYSCFGSSIRYALDALGLAPDDPRGVTVTGGLPFAGGPGSNYLLHSVATMVDVLRDDPGSLRPGQRRRHAHDQARLRRLLDRRPARSTRPTTSPSRTRSTRPTNRVEIVDVHAGPATVATYSVVHGRDGGAEWGLAVCDLPDGGRCYARVGRRRAAGRDGGDRVGRHRGPGGAGPSVGLGEGVNVIGPEAAPWPARLADSPRLVAGAGRARACTGDDGGDGPHGRPPTTGRPDAPTTTEAYARWTVARPTTATRSTAATYRAVGRDRRRPGVAAIDADGAPVVADALRRRLFVAAVDGGRASRRRGRPTRSSASTTSPSRSRSATAARGGSSWRPTGDRRVVVRVSPDDADRGHRVGRAACAPPTDEPIYGLTERIVDDWHAVGDRARRGRARSTAGARRSTMYVARRCRATSRSTRAPRATACSSTASCPAPTTSGRDDPDVLVVPVRDRPRSERRGAYHLLLRARPPDDPRRSTTSSTGWPLAAARHGVPALAGPRRAARRRARRPATGVDDERVGRRRPRGLRASTTSPPASTTSTDRGRSGRRASASCASIPNGSRTPRRMLATAGRAPAGRTEVWMSPWAIDERGRGGRGRTAGWRPNSPRAHRPHRPRRRRLAPGRRRRVPRVARGAARRRVLPRPRRRARRDLDRRRRRLRRRPQRPPDPQLVPRRVRRVVPRGDRRGSARRRLRSSPGPATPARQQHDRCAGAATPAAARGSPIPEAPIESAPSTDLGLRSRAHLDAAGRLHGHAVLGQRHRRLHGRGPIPRCTPAGSRSGSPARSCASTAMGGTPWATTLTGEPDQELIDIYRRYVVLRHDPTCRPTWRPRPRRPPPPGCRWCARWCWPGPTRRARSTGGTSGCSAPTCWSRRCGRAAPGSGRCGSRRGSGSTSGTGARSSRGRPRSPSTCRSTSSRCGSAPTPPAGRRTDAVTRVAAPFGQAFRHAISSGQASRRGPVDTLPEVRGAVASLPEVQPGALAQSRMTDRVLPGSLVGMLAGPPGTEVVTPDAVRVIAGERPVRPGVAQRARRAHLRGGSRRRPGCS